MVQTPRATEIPDIPETTDLQEIPDVPDTTNDIAEMIAETTPETTPTTAPAIAMDAGDVPGTRDSDSSVEGLESSGVDSSGLESSGLDFSGMEESIPSTPPSKEDQLKMLNTALTARLEISSTVYLIPAKWCTQFNAWARGDTQQQPTRVNPVVDLCDSQGNLVPEKIETRDWLASNEDGWSLIRKWYLLIPKTSTLSPLPRFPSR
jgi:hypothetical protein